MALNHQPVCRICRREGKKLFLKGDKCLGPKCTFEKKGYAPGMHGRTRRGKISQYGIQLREKQKIRETYGLLERQFHRFFGEAQRQKGVTGENLLGMLERRLDNIIHRIGFGASRAMARQLVRHGHVAVNGKKVNIPSYIVRPNDVVEIREGSRSNAAVTGSLEATAHLPAPNWIEVDRENLKARILAHPKRSDLVQIKLDEQLIVELYSK